ncbi:hypothetical protein [Natrarchaeobius oligotrophus]|uniref:hypothetical protein n=1 Tax=Natrarchaeobius oligotrophus TaxID=3455743 RepID=UPI001A9EA9B5|nr:hypothetical protein [Natrarchaeobius chitinivorans]
MYERHFGTDWEVIDDQEEVVRRAFALGVAARLGETHPGELDRLGEQIDTNYDQSFVELAFQKGRTEASDVQRKADDDEQVWDALVDGKTIVENPRDESADAEFEDVDGDDTIPEALRRVAIDTLPDDSTDRVKRPSLLDRDRSPGRTREGRRTVFGRSMDRTRGGKGDGRSTDDPSDDGDSGGDGARGETRADEPSGESSATTNDRAGEPSSAADDASGTEGDASSTPDSGSRRHRSSDSRNGRESRDERDGRNASESEN